MISSEMLARYPDGKFGTILNLRKNIEKRIGNGMETAKIRQTT